MRWASSGEASLAACLAIQRGSAVCLVLRLRIDCGWWILLPPSYLHRSIEVANWVPLDSPPLGALDALQSRIGSDQELKELGFQWVPPHSFSCPLLRLELKFLICLWLSIAWWKTSRRATRSCSMALIQILSNTRLNFTTANWGCCHSFLYGVQQVSHMSLLQWLMYSSWFVHQMFEFIGFANCQFKLCGIIMSASLMPGIKASMPHACTCSLLLRCSASGNSKKIAVTSKLLCCVMIWNLSLVSCARRIAFCPCFGMMTEASNTNLATLLLRMRSLIHFMR